MCFPLPRSIKVCDGTGSQSAPSKNFPKIPAAKAIEIVWETVEFMGNTVSWCFSQRKNGGNEGGESDAIQVSIGNTLPLKSRGFPVFAQKIGRLPGVST